MIALTLIFSCSTTPTSPSTFYSIPPAAPLSVTVCAGWYETKETPCDAPSSAYDIATRVPISSRIRDDDDKERKKRTICDGGAVGNNFIDGVDRCCATVSARKPDFASLPVECFYFYTLQTTKTQTVFILKTTFLWYFFSSWSGYIDPLNGFTDGFNPRAFKVFPVNFVSRNSENLFKYRKI